MKTVWKYKIKINETFELELPIGARIILIGLQHNDLCLWAEVDTEVETEKRFFRIHGTGHPINEGFLNHIKSFIDGDFVWHIYEERKS